MDVWGEWMDDGGWMFGWINGCKLGERAGGRQRDTKGWSVPERGNTMHKAAESGACLEWIFGWVDGC